MLLVMSILDIMNSSADTLPHMMLIFTKLV